MEKEFKKITSELYQWGCEECGHIFQSLHPEQLKWNVIIHQKACETKRQKAQAKKEDEVTLDGEKSLTFEQSKLKEEQHAKH